MGYLLGIDVGTSSVKTALINAENGYVLANVEHEYPISQPRPGYAEQDPEDWWQATVKTVRAAVDQAAVDTLAIEAIGLSGQMHGAVCLDESCRPLCPAIIWADTRSRDQVDHLLTTIDPQAMTQYAPGPPAAGFMGPTLMWLRQHEPETLAQTHWVVSPKDYVRLRLTGEIGTDHSDAAATWLLDIQSGDWSDWLIAQCGLERHYLPPVHHAAEVIGTLRPEAVEALRLRPGIRVIAGCADQPAQALGYGLVDPGTALVTVGTGGQVFYPLCVPQTDSHLRLHVFNHAVPERWYALAAILAGGLSLRWLRNLLGLSQMADAYDYLSRLADDVPAGADGLLFLPYLAGERTPHMDPAASGAFIGLRLHHGAGHLARAVMEGVAYAMRACLELIADVAGEPPRQVIASGGAAKSRLWRQIQADIYNIPLTLAPDANYACIGAALLAGIGSGVYDSLDDARSCIPQLTAIVTPDLMTFDLYGQRGEIYRALYDDLKQHMHRLSEPAPLPPPLRKS
jgi:xylulokinase